MSISHVQSVSWNQHFREHVPVKRGSQEQDQKNLFFHPVSSKGLEKSLISYKIDKVKGSITAEVVDSESGKVIRQIEVKPDISMIFQKGSLFESVI